ncbi:MAG: VCBS repeat-containing protein [Bryobacterales bacterium]|nr:VCBS repeat-containing protein [Bryobacterales bacterium]
MRILLSLLVLAAIAPAQTRFAQFHSRVLAEDLAGGYQVVAVDVNKDGKLDLVALASGMTELLWFEAPNWDRRVLATGLKRMINTWPLDTDGDGIPEFLVAHAFENEAARSVGIVSLLTHGPDIRQPWTLREIDRLTTSHRIRVANGLFINAPLTGASAVAPEYRDHTPLVAYRPGDWHRQLITGADEGVVHGLFIHDWNRDGREDVLTASFRGIHVNLAQPGGAWTREKITDGDPAPWPKSGSSDIAVGTLGRERYLAAIEPWHGNQIVVYRQKQAAWSRVVADDSLVDGHTIFTADLNGDGKQEIVAGFRGGSRGVYIYYEEGGRWIRQVVSEGAVAAAACTVADLNNDRRPDIACIGSATRNLMLYTQK